MSTKPKNSKFKVSYSEEEYSHLMKKYKGDISNLNKAIKNSIRRFMDSNRKTTYDKIRKDVYVSAELNEDIAIFCIDKNINRSQMAELIKKDLL